MDRTLFHLPAPLPQAPDWQLAADAHRIGRHLPVSQFPRGAYLPSKYLRINSRLRPLAAHNQTITAPPPRHLPVTESVALPPVRAEASWPDPNRRRPSF